MKNLGEQIETFLQKYHSKDIRVIDHPGKKYQADIDKLLATEPVLPLAMVNGPAAFKNAELLFKIKEIARHEGILNFLDRAIESGCRVTFHTLEVILNEKVIQTFFADKHINPSLLKLSRIKLIEPDQKPERYVKNYIWKDIRIDGLRALLEAINISPDSEYTAGGEILLVHMSWSTSWAISIDQDKNIRFLGIGAFLPTLLEKHCLEMISFYNKYSKICRFSLAGSSAVGQILAVQHTLVCKNGLPSVLFLDTWKAITEEEKDFRKYLHKDNEFPRHLLINTYSKDPGWI